MAKDHILIPISHFLCKSQLGAQIHKTLCSFATSSKKKGKGTTNESADYKYIYKYFDNSE